MLEAYRQHVAERAALGIPPLPLSKQQTQALVELLQNPPAGEEAFLVDLLTHRVPAGVDDAAVVEEFECLASPGPRVVRMPLSGRTAPVFWRRACRGVERLRREQGGTSGGGGRQGHGRGYSRKEASGTRGA